MTNPGTEPEKDVDRVVAGMGGPAIAYRSFESARGPVPPSDAALPAEAPQRAVPEGSAAAMFSLLGAALSEAADIRVSPTAPPTAEPDTAQPVATVSQAPILSPPAAPPIEVVAPPAPVNPFPARMVPPSAPIGGQLSIRDMFRILSDRPTASRQSDGPDSWRAFPFRRR